MVGSDGTRGGLSEDALRSIIPVTDNATARVRVHG